MADKFHGDGSVIADDRSISIAVVLRKTLDSTELTGILAASVTGSYWRQGGSRVAISVSDLAAVDSAYSGGGWKEVDATNMPGVYRFDIPDGAWLEGADWVIVAVKVASAFVVFRRFSIATRGLRPVWNQTQAIKPFTDNLPGVVKRGTAFNNYPFKMVLSSDHNTPATGKTVTAKISRDGAALVATTNSVAEIANGWYKINFTATEMTATTIALLFTATDCDPALQPVIVTVA